MFKLVAATTDKFMLLAVFNWEQAEVGKISFGVNYGENRADLEQAVANALQCFEDGIYRIFLGTEQLRKLDDTITLAEDCELTFVRLTMLVGRMW